jgi:hypothetical protein
MDNPAFTYFAAYLIFRDPAMRILPITMPIFVLSITLISSRLELPPNPE